MNITEWRSIFVYFQGVKIGKRPVSVVCPSQEAAQVDVYGSSPEIILASVVIPIFCSLYLVTHGKLNVTRK